MSAGIGSASRGGFIYSLRLAIISRKTRPYYTQPKLLEMI